MLRNKYLGECNTRETNDERKLSTGRKKKKAISPNDEWCMHAASKFTVTAKRKCRASKRSKTFEAKLGERLAEGPRGTAGWKKAA